ncbi:OLC1v1038223C1 [Oldenlandia corymbosa var. corymbosa]|uniref:OLC1v1038223C1 n=1 Tax=Oldenlandia corymbosa var. corymbosa TaxID=529605 RepID=A0AAV1D2D8_OLDCO|nr:OLC1v1038223C1 [Oldenlandia corymbosa var. corymbosa]
MWILNFAISAKSGEGSNGGNTVIMGGGDLGMIRKEWRETSQSKKRNRQNKTVTPISCIISSPPPIETLDDVKSRPAARSDAIADLEAFVLNEVTIFCTRHDASLRSSSVQQVRLSVDG